MRGGRVEGRQDVRLVRASGSRVVCHGPVSRSRACRVSNEVRADCGANHANHG